MEGPAGLLLALGVFALFTLMGYHRLYNLRKQAHDAWHHIQEVMPGLYKSVPDLLNALERLSDREEKELEALRNLSHILADSNRPINAWIKADNSFREKIAHLPAQRAKSPGEEEINKTSELVENFLQTSQQMDETREAFNKVATPYNHACIMFPSNVFALIFRFTNFSLFVVKGKDELNPSKAQGEN